MTVTVALVCRTRRVTAAGQPVGPICGHTFTAEPHWDGTDYIDPTPSQHLNAARAAGWSVAGPPMCPTCRQPAATIGAPL